MNVKIFSIILLAMGLPGACAPVTTNHSSTVTAIEQDPENAAMLPLSYGWKTGYSAVLTPPESVRTQAKEACLSRGFDRAYMVTLVLDNDKATAIYGCRGADT